MKLIIFVIMLMIVVFVSGCASNPTPNPSGPIKQQNTATQPTPENISDDVNSSFFDESFQELDFAGQL